ncbi:hypothetical protein OSB04_007242 [Centaurea solstitialis]|uniref:non-specific serine/threonine protein kinase n=1 Tax=Centaurea solstitialis TaxID=347529 RepID=A0AA38WIF0_9ASTR|nr:hypothetical protein OSB04_007242 [Centaurea solstitialis]
MKSNFHPCHTTFFPLTLILVTTIHFPAIWCQETEYNVCGRLVQCGNIVLDYPFWGLGRPSYCGHSGLQLTCQSNITILRYESLDFRVLRMDGDTQTITIARNDIWDSFCPRYLYNTTYNSSLFNANKFDQEDLSLYYGCDSNDPSGCDVNGCRPTLLLNNQFNCNVSGTERYMSYFFITNLIPNDTSSSLLVQCNNHMIVPLSQSSADRLASPNATRSDLREAITSGFNLQWTAYKEECDLCVRSHGRCGSNSTSRELFACYCDSGEYSLTCNRSLTRNEGIPPVFNLSFFPFPSIFLEVRQLFFDIMKLFVILYRKRRLLKSQNAINHHIESFIKNYGSLAPKRFKYSEIKNITNFFLEKLGQGGYGSVYKGQLPNGNLVAVKLLNGVMGGGEDFINEVASISRTSHVNIVTLLGFCIKGKKRALMYEFMPNGSLDKFLCGDGSHLDWNTLFRIAKGIARGLEYLHQGCNTRIVHFDIKPHNILLDEEFIPKISDFGLAKLCKRKESIVSVIGGRGTAGYMAPEVFLKSLGGASHKSDVYSYGMMVLEMTGTHNNNTNVTSTSEAYFPDWIYKQVEARDNLGVNGVTSEEEEELARKMVIVSLWCIQSDPLDRPSISKVVEMLEGNFQSLQVPPRRFWSSPTRLAQGTPSSLTQSSSEMSDGTGIKICKMTGLPSFCSYVEAVAVGRSGGGGRRWVEAVVAAGGGSKRWRRPAVGRSGGGGRRWVEAVAAAGGGSKRSRRPAVGRSGRGGRRWVEAVAAVGGGLKRSSKLGHLIEGFLHQGEKRALMYEFMPNGSLDKFLCGDGSRLDWNTLFRIAKGIARGLEYLHQGCNTRIVHFDIKPHNILLDEEFIPKISDFGLAKLCKRKESIVSVIGGRDWIYKQVEAGDNLGVNGVTSEEEEELARKMVIVSLWCIQSDPLDRPSISKVVEMLEGNFQSLQVPPRRFWSSPTRLAQGTPSSLTQSSTG